MPATVSEAELEPTRSEATDGSCDDLLARLDVLRAHPVYLHTSNAQNLDITGLCSSAEQALTLLQRTCQVARLERASPRLRAAESALDYASYALTEARQNLKAGAIPALIAAQLADAVRAMHLARAELEPQGQPPGS